jgi:tetratricopeptide (TPR) repeat protein
MLSACVSEKIKQSLREQVGTIVAVGRRLAEAGQWDPAYRLFMRATELAPSNEEAWIWRAGVAGDAAESVICLKRVLELDPQNAQARAGLRWAAAQIPVATADSSQLAAAAVEDGQRALQEGDCVRAHERFKRATELDAQSVSAWFWRGSTAPEINEALTCMDRILAIEPENEAARDTRWWLHVQELRERTSALANTRATLTAIDPHANPSTQKKDGITLFIAFTLVVLLVCGLLALLVTLRLAGIV